LRGQAERRQGWSAVVARTARRGDAPRRGHAPDPDPSPPDAV